MKRWFIGCTLVFITTITILAVVVYQAYQVLYEPYTHQLLIRSTFFDMEPEDIFKRYMFDEYPSPPIPSEVTQIKGLQGSPRLNSGWQGPVFLRFDASERYIHELIEREYPYGSYAQISCTQFFDTREQQSYPTEFPELFEWWSPAEVSEPVCYQLKLDNHNANAARYLLVDSTTNEVYFYRTFVAGSTGPD